jgi:hypothetical protein
MTYERLALSRSFTVVAVGSPLLLYALRVRPFPSPSPFPRPSLLLGGCRPEQATRVSDRPGAYRSLRAGLGACIPDRLSHPRRVRRPRGLQMIRGRAYGRTPPMGPPCRCDETQFSLKPVAPHRVLGAISQTQTHIPRSLTHGRSKRRAPCFTLPSHENLGLGCHGPAESRVTAPRTAGVMPRSGSSPPRWDGEYLPHRRHHSPGASAGNAYHCLTSRSSVTVASHSRPTSS